VWADGTGADFTSTANNQFNVRAHGGVRFETAGAGVTVDGGRVVAAQLTTDVPLRSNMVNVVNGSPVNFVAAGVRGATISGGGAGNYDGVAYTNSIAADLGTIAGGAGNVLQVLSDGAAIGGGSRNRILGAYNAVIAGGVDNTIQSGAANGSIAGGRFNVIQTNAFAAHIAGGYQNMVGGSYSFAAGFAAAATGNYSLSMGDNTTAGGVNSAAFGSYAKALHRGSFVWADTLGGDFASTGNEQFCIRAAGGIQLSGNTSISFGASLGPKLNLYSTTYGIGVQAATIYHRVGVGGVYAWYAGGVHNDNTFNSGGGATLMSLTGSGLTVNGVVVSSSDRNLKSGFAPVDAREILEKVARLPIQRWHFTNDPATPHLGPVAQDFHAAFNLGADGRHIATVDADGVALAAIQGLNQKVEEKEQRIRELERTVGELKELVRELAATREESR
jgi:hypothetical protein